MNHGMHTPSHSAQFIHCLGLLECQGNCFIANALTVYYLCLWSLQMTGAIKVYPVNTKDFLCEQMNQCLKAKRDTVFKTIESTTVAVL